MKIEDYSFGTIIIDGSSYTNDLKIIDGQIIRDWWRKEGHGLCLEDIKDVLDSDAQTFVMGCGYAGILKVTASFKDLLSKKGIQIMDVPTRKAVDLFNSSSDLNKTAFGFHLTC